MPARISIRIRAAKLLFGITKREGLAAQKPDQTLEGTQKELAESPSTESNMSAEASMYGRTLIGWS